MARVVCAAGCYCGGLDLFALLAGGDPRRAEPPRFTANHRAATATAPPVKGQPFTARHPRLFTHVFPLPRSAVFPATAVRQDAQVIHGKKRFSQNGKLLCHSQSKGFAFCVYCAARSGRDPAYYVQATACGKLLADEGLAAGLRAGDARLMGGGGARGTGGGEAIRWA